MNEQNKIKGRLKIMLWKNQTGFQHMYGIVACGYYFLFYK